MQAESLELEWRKCAPFSDEIHSTVGVVHVKHDSLTLKGRQPRCRNVQDCTGHVQAPHRTCTGPVRILYRARTGACADSLHNSYHGSAGVAQAPYKNRAGPARGPCRACTGPVRGLYGPCTVPVQNRGTYTSHPSFKC